MKIYFTHSTNFDFKNEFYTPIRNSVLNSQHQITLPHETNKYINSNEIIKNSDLVIAEVSNPSTGMGIELGWTSNFNIPIIFIYKEDSKISSSLKSLSNNFIEYKNSQDLIDRLTVNIPKSDPNNKSTSENPVGRFMVAAGAVIELNSTGKILILQRSPKLDWHPSEWEICYGRIDQFEDVETGLKRELFEELGLKEVDIVKILRVWHIFRGSKKATNELVGITYHCRSSNKNVKLSKEHTNFQWLKPEKAIKLIINKGIKDDLKVFIRKYE